MSVIKNSVTFNSICWNFEVYR